MNTEEHNEDDLSLKDQNDVVEVPAEDAAQEQGVLPQQTKTTKAASEILLEFLEVAVHQVLYVRKLYPEGIFLQRKKYNIPVHISSHPGLNEYINSALLSLMKILQENKVSYISVLIKDDTKPVENFMFELKLMQEMLNEGKEFIELEQSLRSFLLKILSSASSLPILPESCSFEILVGCSSDCEVDLNVTDAQSVMKWTTVDPADFSRPLVPDRLIPIKALTDSSILNIQLVAELMGRAAEPLPEGHCSI